MFPNSMLSFPTWMPLRGSGIPVRRRRSLPSLSKIRVLHVYSTVAGSATDFVSSKGGIGVLRTYFSAEADCRVPRVDRVVVIGDQGPGREVGVLFAYRPIKHQQSQLSTVWLHIRP